MIVHNGGQINNVQLITGVVNSYKIAVLIYIKRALQVFYKLKKGGGGAGRVNVNQGQVVDVNQVNQELKLLWNWKKNPGEGGGGGFGWMWPKNWS